MARGWENFKIITYLCLFKIILLSVACTKGNSTPSKCTLFSPCLNNTVGGSPTPSPTPTPIVTFDDSSPFRLSINAYSDGDTKLENANFTESCAIPIGADLGTQEECLIMVPQSQLYLNQFKLALSSPEKQCEFIRVEPYYYRASTSKEFQAEWNNNTVVDCSTGLNKNCFSGAGITLLSPNAEGTSFSSHLIYSPSQKAFSESWLFPSALSSNRKSNRWLSNFFDFRENTVTALSGDGYVANSMQDWKFTCTDSYDNLQYALLLKVISDSGTAPVKYPAWEGVTIASPVISPFSLQVTSFWQSDTSNSFPTLQSTCEAVAGNSAKVSCDVHIPEGQLYYSQLKFSLTAPANSCDIIYFYPQIYQASNATLRTPEGATVAGKGFTAQWNSLAAVECAPLTGFADANCFSGAGVELLTRLGYQFPKSIGLVHQPYGNSVSLSWTVKSAHQADRSSNRWTASLDENSSVYLNGTNYGGDGLVPYTLQNWNFRCVGANDNLLYEIAPVIIADPQTIPNPSTKINTWH